MKFFTNCKSLDELKAEYRRLIKIHHPDCGGDAEVMKQVTKDVVWRDTQIAGSMARLEYLLSELREYRQALAARYAELETLAYKYTLRLERCPHWQGRIEYIVTLEKTREDGTKSDELREVFSGKDRKKAFELFAQIKTQRPGIEAVQDTEKRQWEK